MENAIKKRKIQRDITLKLLREEVRVVLLLFIKKFGAFKGKNWSFLCDN